MWQPYLRSISRSETGSFNRVVCRNIHVTNNFWRWRSTIPPLPLHKYGGHSRMPLTSAAFRPCNQQNTPNNNMLHSNMCYHPAQRWISLAYTGSGNGNGSSNNTNTTNTKTTLMAATTKRQIQTEREFLTIVTNTLQTIHDTVDGVLDEQTFITDYEISLSQGVLTMKFPPHGTWVLNQQTPNCQIWWSSPLSGPKRFEYDDTDQLWFSTKDGLNLGHALAEEIHHIYPDLDPIELDV